MGLYDTVELAPSIAQRLPSYDPDLIGKAAEDVKWQTKSIDHPMMESYRVTADGYLERERVERETVPKEERPYPDAEEGLKALAGIMRTNHLGWERLDAYHGTVEIHRGFWDIDPDESEIIAKSESESKSESEIAEGMRSNYLFMGFELLFTHGRLESIVCTEFRSKDDLSIQGHPTGEREHFSFDFDVESEDDFEEDPDNDWRVDIHYTGDDLITVKYRDQDISISDNTLYEAIFEALRMIAVLDDDAPSPEELVEMARETFQQDAEESIPDPEGGEGDGEAYELFDPATDQHGPGGDD